MTNNFVTTENFEQVHAPFLPNIPDIPDINDIITTENFEQELTPYYAQQKKNVEDYCKKIIKNSKLVSEATLKNKLMLL